MKKKPKEHTLIVKATEITESKSGMACSGAIKFEGSPLVIGHVLGMAMAEGDAGIKETIKVAMAAWLEEKLDKLGAEFDKEIMDHKLKEGSEAKN